MKNKSLEERIKELEKWANAYSYSGTLPSLDCGIKALEIIKELQEGITLNAGEAQLIIESLRELSVNEEEFQFGPSYEVAKGRKSYAIKILKEKLDKLNQK